MKLAVLVCAYNEHEMIRACLRQFPKEVEKILVLQTRKPWQGKPADTDDEQTRALMEIHDERVERIKGDWKTENDQRNFGLGRLYDFDWVVVTDPDEFYQPNHWLRMFAALERTKASVAVAPMITYWKGMEYVISPPDTHLALVAVRPQKTAFSDKRDVVEQDRLLLPITMHHLSWAKSDRSIWQKLQNYSHATDFDTKKWYNEKWKGWTLETTGLLPYGGNCQETKAIMQSLPNSIKKLF